MNRTHVVMLALGVAFGVLAFWVYSRRESIGFAVQNRGSSTVSLKSSKGGTR